MTRKLTWGAGGGSASMFGSSLLLWLALAAAIISSACASRSDSELTSAVHEDYRSVAPDTIGVLPFENMTVDLDATPLIRPIVAERLRHKGYRVPGLEAVDATLHEEGVLIAHDVHAFTARELGEMLGVDAVMFGTVTDFTTKYAGVYASVAVQLRLELVDCATGEIIWQNEQRAARNTAAESIITLLLYHDEIEKGLAVVAASNALFAALEQIHPYAEEAARRNLATLPAGPGGTSAYPFDTDPNAFDKATVKGMIYQSVIRTAPRD